MAKDSNNGWRLCGDGPEAYERYIVPAFSGAWARDMVARAGIQNGERILDLGCGTGIVARQVLKHMGKSCQITGVDVNAVVLEKAREICSPKSEPDTWKQSDATTLPFSDGDFDVIMCQQGLQYFSDRPRTLQEITRVLAQGGRAFLYRKMCFQYQIYSSCFHH